MNRIRFMNIEIDNVSLVDAVENINQRIEDKEKMYVVTPNVDHIVKLQKDKKFLNAYKNAGLIAVDGTPIMIASKWYGTPLKEKITGPRLVEGVIELAAKKAYSVFFLGAGPGVGEKAAKNLLAKYPGFKYVGFYSPPFGFENCSEEIAKIIEIINIAHPDIVIAGMGSPKTEIFLEKIYRELDASVSMSVGAAIDFFAGTVKRCPGWINKIGMEWFYRFLKEPRRMFKRYFMEDIRFFSLVIKYRKIKDKNYYGI